jgi:hypothetical protein
MDGSTEGQRPSRGKQLLYLKLAFLAMEPSNCILSLAVYVPSFPLFLFVVRTWKLTTSDNILLLLLFGDSDPHWFVNLRHPTV